MRLWMLAFLFPVSALNIQSKAASKAPDGTSEENVCSNPDCYKMGVNISMYINRSANPCTDFYDYVCKNWKASNPVPDYMPSYGHLWLIRDELMKQLRDLLGALCPNESNQKLEDKIGLAYQSCMKNDTPEDESVLRLSNILKSFGIYEWPMENQSGEVNNVNWKDIYKNVKIGADLDFILSVNVETYFLNTTIRAISMDTPSFVPSLQQISDAKKEDNATMAYLEFIRETVDIFSNLSNDTVNKIAEDIFHFEVALAKLLTEEYDVVYPPDLIFPNGSIDDYPPYDYSEYATEEPTAEKSTVRIDTATVQSTDKPSTQLKDIDARLDSDGWRQLLENIFANISINLTGNEEVNVRKESYFKEVMELINKTEKAIVNNYLGWKVLCKLGPIASEKMRNLNLDFNKVWRGLKEGKEPRWRECVKALNDPYDPIIGYGLGHLYIKKYFNETQKEDAYSLAEVIKNSTEALIRNTTWMDGATKEKAIKKLQNMVFKVGYPDDISNETVVESMYNSVQSVDASDVFVNIYLKFRRNNAVRKLQKIHTAYDRTKEWSLEPTSVNGYHSLRENSGVFPAVLLQYPFYAYGVPSYAKMGTMGFILGHEVSHAFFGPGNKYYLNGSMETWWSENTTEQFKNPAKCIEHLYSNMTEETTHLQVNGERTLNENLADIWGLEASFNAHKKLLKDNPNNTERLPCLTDFDDDKLFFITLAYSFCQNDQEAELIDFVKRDLHTPSKIRVNTLLGNSKSFFDTFQCNKSDAMFKMPRCYI